MSSLRERVEGLVANWRKATKGISADGFERPLEWEGKDILRLCADELAAALVAEGQGAACGIIGYLDSGRKVCELVAGHADYHKQGTSLWLGARTPYLPEHAEMKPGDEILICAKLINVRERDNEVTVGFDSTTALVFPLKAVVKPVKPQDRHLLRHQQG